MPCPAFRFAFIRPQIPRCAGAHGATCSDLPCWTVHGGAPYAAQTREGLRVEATARDRECAVLMQALCEGTNIPAHWICGFAVFSRVGSVVHKRLTVRLAWRDHRPTASDRHETNSSTLLQVIASFQSLLSSGYRWQQLLLERRHPPFGTSYHVPSHTCRQDRHSLLLLERY